jgi:hypothetical protein
VTVPRYELPANLSPEERRAVLTALERAQGAVSARPSAWALAGRIEALRLGALQARRDIQSRWSFRGDFPFARRGTPPLVGRGDAR